MNVLVTGGCGFIGSHVVEKLIEQDHVVRIIDRAHPTHPEDLSISAGLDLTGTEAVIHLAAHADVRGNWDGPTALTDIVCDNVIGTLAILDACVQVKTIKSFVFVSTGAVYAEQMSPYAASKLTGEHWCKAYADKFGWGLTTIRPAACYGRGYHHGHIADFVKMAKETGAIKSLTRGLPRDGLHVEDLAEMLIRAAVKEWGMGKRQVTHYMRGETKWGCQDTVGLMGVEATWGSADQGWLGDTHDSPANALLGGRSIREGVKDALKSLGWGQ